MREPLPLLLERGHVLAAIAILFILFAPYQTLVQTVITDDAVRKGIEADDYDMIWVTVAYGGLDLRCFLRYRAVDEARQAGHAGDCHARLLTRRHTLWRCDWPHQSGDRPVCRGLRQDAGDGDLPRHALQALRPPLARGDRVLWHLRLLDPAHDPARERIPGRIFVMAVDVLGVCASRGNRCGLVWRFIRPDRPPKTTHASVDWLVIHTFVAWVIAIVFAFAWYRKWGGWSSNAFVSTVGLCCALPVLLIIRLGSGFSPDEHLKRILRTRVYVLSLTTRGLMLLHMVAVLTIIGEYCTELRAYPRITAGWLMVPASATMAATTVLTTWFHRRSLRHVWLTVGFVGSAACVWWLSSIDNFTSKEHLAVMLACWGAFIGLIPPVFLTDEIEGLDPRDMLSPAPWESSA